MKVLFLLLTFFLSSSIGFAQPTVQWAKQMGGAAWDNGNSIAVDAAGNVYTTGGFPGTVDFDPGAGTANLTSAGSNDIFIQKLDAAGNYLWAVRMGSASSDYGTSIAVDASGNVYTTGVFQGTVDFDPSAVTANLTSAGARDIFIQKLDAAGNYVWARRMGSPSSDYGRTIAVDASGNVYTAGYFTGTADFDPGVGIANLTSAGGYDIFVSKLDGAGNYLWAKGMGGSVVFFDNDYGYSIAVDAAENVYTTGVFQETADFDPGAGTANLTSAGGADIFISKLDASGSYVWAKRMGSVSVDLGNSIAVDAAGNVYTTGKFVGTVDFDPGAGTANLTSAGGSDIFISKLDASGNYLCAKRMGGTGTEYANSIVLDASGNIFITGDQYSATADYDPGVGVYNLINTGTEATFVAQYDNNCDFICAFIITPGHNETNYDRHLAVAGSNLYLVNNFDDATADFDACVGTSNLPNNGGKDIAVAKYDLSSSCGCSFVLPIGLLSFTGENNGNSNILRWQTTSESNNHYFSVQHSIDGNLFREIQTINGAGNSNTLNNYTYVHTNENVTLSGVEVYYRLKQVDYDGQYTYSKTISISINNASANPVIQQTVNYLVISMYDIAAPEATISVYDILGREVYHERLKGSLKRKILLNKFKSGNYYIYIKTEGKNYRQKLFIH